MNKIVASRINLLAMSLNCGLAKRSSSHIDSELKVSSSTPGISESDQENRSIRNICFPNKGIKQKNEEIWERK